MGKVPSGAYDGSTNASTGYWSMSDPVARQRHRGVRTRAKHLELEHPAPLTTKHSTPTSESTHWQQLYFKDGADGPAPTNLKIPIPRPPGPTTPH
jgi:hypothetical protein